VFDLIRDILRDIEMPTWVKMSALWCVSAFHFVNDNLPAFIGWGTLIYTAMQLVIGYRKMRAKPTV
jgi:hypothetical protein